MKLRQATLAHYKDGTPTIKIIFPFDPDDIALIKTIPSRKWNPEGRFWTCPPTNKALEILKLGRFIIDPELEKHICNLNRNDLVTNIPGLKKQLFKYQLSGVSFLESHKGRGLIGDDMGLGKTMQAIGWLQLHPEIRPAIIVCPASVKLNWAKEISDWMGESPPTVEILNGTTPYILQGTILLINYDILSDWVDSLKEINPKVIVGDEIQMIKNHKTKRTKAMRKLVRGVPHFIALSGTPIINRPIEFYNAIQLIDRELFPNWWEFTMRYCNRKHDGFGWNVSGASNTEELHHILTESIMIRRSKEEVLTDLPEKIRGFIPIEMNAELKKQYIYAENNFVDFVRMTKGIEAANRASNAEMLTQIETLKQLAASAKLDNAIAWIDDFLESGEKLIVFATHKTVINTLYEKYQKLSVKLDGTVTGVMRQAVVEKFQNEPEIRLFIGNIKAAGIGITLTASSNVAFLELPWAPGELVQAEDRCHRIGQKNTVNIYYLLAEHTIEEKIAALLDKKRKILNSVLDGIETDEQSLLLELIENYQLE